MKNDFNTQILLLIAGAIAGILSGAVGAAYKAYLDRRSELQKSEAAIRLQYLYPLLVVAIDLKRQLLEAYNILQSEKEINRPEPEMTDRYYLRYWFWRCKEYVVNPDTSKSEEERRKELVMHSGGAGYGAISILYLTANYLWHSTRVRLQMPSELRGRGVELLTHLSRVRTALTAIEFYGVAQDSTGKSMMDANGEPMTYSEFCKAMTSDAQRACFLTLTDVYFKLYRANRDNLEKVMDSLRRVIALLGDILELSPEQIPE